MKKIILSLTMALVIHYSNSQVTSKSDLQELEVKGKVKSLRETSYKAINVSGKIQKGKRKTENSDEKDSFISFNEKGNKIERIEYTSDGKTYEKLSYLYDDKGYDTIIYNEKDSHNLIAKYVHKYDEKGNLIERRHYNPDGSNDNIYTYKYDENKNLVEYNWFKKDGNFGSKDIYKYDTKGNMLEDATYKSDERLEWKITYEYNDSGNCVEENTYKGSKFYIKYLKKFDDKGNQIEIDLCKEDGTPYRKYYQKYEYDKNGNWVMQTQFEKDKPTYIYERELVYF